MRALVQRADADGEFLSAIVAVMPAGALVLARQFANRIQLPAVGAKDAIGRAML
jgi:hypothetical protein